MDQLKKLLKNQYLTGFLIIVTVLYASLARPVLPLQLIRIFEFPITKNIQVALVVSIAFYTLMNLIREQKIAEGFLDELEIEGFYQGNQSFNN